MTKDERFDGRPRAKRLNALPQNPEGETGRGRFPSWLHRKLPKGGNLWKTQGVVKEQRLHTVCEEAKCPNLLECWTKKTATFLAMGKECTRACGFCDIDFSKTPPPLDPQEPIRIAESVATLGLEHAVITMVARDDLLDGGADHLAKIIRLIRVKSSATVEVLTSDFQARPESLDLVIQARPEIFNYNIETVRELTSKVRHTATYDRTLEVLSYAKAHSNAVIKSGIMVGLGESDEQVRQTITDLQGVGVDVVTIGQYLQPNRHKLRVKKFIEPKVFKEYEEFGLSIGIKQMYCGPFVRSSYNAGDVLKSFKQT